MARPAAIDRPRAPWLGLLAALLLPTLGAIGPLMAQSQTQTATIYRCGPQGRDLRDAPCPDAAAKPPQVLQYEQPSAADRQAARQQTRRDAEQAEALRAQRLRDEEQALQRNAGAAGILGVRQAPAAEPAASAASGKKPSAKKSSEKKASAKKAASEKAARREKPPR